MRLLLTGRQVEITPNLRRLVEARLAKLERRFGEALVSAQVVLSREKNRVVAEVVVHARQDHTLAGVGATTDVGHGADRCSQESAAAGRDGERQVAAAQTVRDVGSDDAARGARCAQHESRKRA